MTIEDSITNIPVAIHCCTHSYHEAGKEAIQQMLDRYFETSVAVQSQYQIQEIHKKWFGEYSLYVDANQLLTSPDHGTWGEPIHHDYRILYPDEIIYPMSDDIRIILMGGESNIHSKFSDGCHKSAYFDFVKWFFSESESKTMEIVIPFNTIFSCLRIVVDNPKYRPNFLLQYSTGECSSIEIKDDVAHMYFEK